MKTIVIHHHFGLGDHIVCNGLVRELIKRENPDRVFLTCATRNLDSVVSMYSDEPRMIFISIPIRGNAPHDHTWLTTIPELKNSTFFIIGHENTRQDWDVGFYDSVGIPFEKRWTSFKCPRDKNREQQLEKMLNLAEGEEFVLAQDYDSVTKRNYEIKTDKRIIYLRQFQFPDGSLSRITDWCGVIEKAKEVHALSSLVHMTTSMGIPGVFHDYCRDSCWGASFVLPKNWTTVTHC
jgi:hypothetical protein